jgi:phosphatidylserine/phosphatidylglycerophosphate/cardiolipin synthase-like enzyme
MLPKVMSYNIAILLRSGQAINRFRSVLLACFGSSELPHLVLGSGFIQEYSGKSSFFSSKQFATAPPSLACKKALILVGLYSSQIWLSHYEAFSNAIAGITCSCGNGVSVLPFRIRRDHWHAKVFLAANNANEFKVGVIGSSNLTSRTFGVNLPFNYETDVVLWDDQDEKVNKLVLAALGVDGNADSEVILARYDGKLSIPDRLGNLYDQILDVL